MIWNDLLKNALIGTERGRLSEKTTAALSELGVRTDLPPEQVLLEGAALVYQLRRTSMKLSAFTGELPAFSDDDASKRTGPKTSHHLKLILDGRFRFALEEFIQLLVRNGYLLPRESLPALLEQSLTDNDLWRDIQPAVGPLGKWLIDNNPRWQTLSSEVNAGNWLTGLPSERRKIIAHLREEAPDEAIKLLERTWEQEHYKDKVDFLHLLFRNLSDSDEPFLERCLDDRRKEVRRQAADLLAHLPGSRMVSRFIRQLDDWVIPEGDDSLALNLPEKFPDWNRRDGIEELRPEYRDVLPPEGWFLQMASRIPPDYWRRRFTLEAPACIRLFSTLKIQRSILQALAEAAFRYDDEEWTEAILLHWANDPDDSLWKTFLTDGWMEKITAPVFNRVTLDHFNRFSTLPGPESICGRLLSLSAHSWTEALTLAFVKSFQDWLADWPGLSSPPRFAQLYLKAAAYKSAPQLLDRVRKGWPMQSRAWPLWEGEVEQFLNTLLFRKEMHRAITGN